jgi:hypothetical protein
MAPSAALMQDSRVDIVKDVSGRAVGVNDNQEEGNEGSSC